MGKLLLFSGTDAVAITAATKKAMIDVAGEEPDDFSTEILREDSENGPTQILERLFESLNTPSFLGGEKTILLQNFSEFGEEPPKKIKQPTGTAKLLRQLGEFILTEFPDDVNLIISGPGLDPRKALAKACLKIGSANFLKKPDINDWGWRQDVMNVLRNKFNAAGVQLPVTAIEYLTDVIGTDTDRIGVELEKVICYAGESPTLKQVQEVCKGNREAHFFAFTKSLGERKLGDTIDALTQTMSNSKNEDGECIRLIRMSANHFRKLLDAKIAMHVLKCGTGRDLKSRVKGASAPDRELLTGNSILSATDWNVGNLGDQAMKYSGKELRAAIHRLSKVDRSNVSSALPNRLILETLIMQIIPKTKSA